MSRTARTPRTSPAGVPAAGTPGPALARAVAASALVALSLLPLSPAPVAAQSGSGGAALRATADDVELTLGGQLRPRLETRDPATADGRALTFTSMRSRLSLTVELPRSVSAFVQIQDVRTWGEEGSTLGDFDADGLDVHQAWLQLGGIGTPASLRFGRQEVAYGGERLVGAVGWTQQGRAFDGVRGQLRSGRLVLDLFGYQIAESATATHDRDEAFLGGYATLGLQEEHALDLYGLWNRLEAPAGPGTDTEQGTFGLRYVGVEGPVGYRVEGAWQTGERLGTDVSAFMLGARAGTRVGERGRVTLWYDYLSGDDPASPDEVGVFSTLFGTNHKFYGVADLFLDIPAQTAGRGLQDAAVKTSLELADAWSAALDVHHFRVAEDAGLAEARLGEEVDLTLRHRYSPNLTLSGGLSYVFEGDALAPVRGIDDDVVFGYLMLDLVF